MSDHTLTAEPPRPAGGRPAEPASALIDIGRALDLLDAAVDDHDAGRAGSGEPPLALAAHALSLDGVDRPQLEPLTSAGLREMFARRRLPAPFTLGALIVFHAAQRAEDRGRSWAESVAYARQVALRFIALLPTRALA
jgi:hypothetical protein